MASNDLRLQVILQAIDKATAPLRQIKGASVDAARVLKDTRAKLKELNEQQKAVGQFREVRSGLTKTSADMQAAQDRVKALAQQIGQVGVPTRAMTREFAKARKEAMTLGEKFSQQQVRAQHLRDRLTAAGISTSALGSHERRLRGEIQSTTASIASQNAALRQQSSQMYKTARLKAQHARAMMHTGMAAGAGYGAYAAGTRGARAVLAPVQSFAAHEDAMLGIARQVPGARDELGRLTPVYRAIEEQVRALSHEIPIATTEIAEMVTTAARMEVPTDQLQSFTRTAAMMATAFDAVPGEITEAMGKVAKNFKIQLTEIEGLADSINFLDDNAISKGADIIGFLNRTSGVISTVAMSARDAAALGSTLLTLGEREETAGTAANAMVQKFAAATKGTKKFQSAMAEIGLTSADVQTGMSKDATGTLLEVIGAIRALPREKQIGVMVELVGMEHSDTLAKLVDKPEELQRQLELARGPQAQGSMRREASARNDTISARWQMTKNRLFNTGAALGDTLKPALTDLLNLVNPLLERFTQWVAANPGLVGGVLKVAAAISALIALAGALLVPLALVAGKVFLMRFLFAQATSVIGPLASILKGPLMSGLLAAGRAILFIGRALLMNPIGLLITAIAVAAFLIYKYWEPISAFFDGLWQTVKTVFNDAMTWFAALPARFAAFGSAIIEGLANGITGALGAVKTAITGAGEAAIGWFKEKLGIKSPSRVFMLAGREISNGAAEGISERQSRVRQAALGMAAAAAVALPMAAGAAGAGTDAGPLQIDRRPPLGAAAAQRSPSIGGDTIHITIQAAPGMDAQALARAVSAELDRRQRSKRATMLSSLSDID